MQNFEAITSTLVIDIESENNTETKSIEEMEKRNTKDI